MLLNALEIFKGDVYEETLTLGSRNDAVSYTHLDVYKRQRLGVAKTGGRPTLRAFNYRPEHVDVQ